MKFENLKDRMEYFKSIVDYKLTPNSYVLVHVDGRSFSKMVKKRFNLPFDDTFIEMMNETASYVCKNIQGCKLAYTQSDEISFLITDFDTPETDSFFGYRLCKMQSIIASLATGKFNQLFITKVLVKSHHSSDDPFVDYQELIEEYTPFQFDCKVWTVPTYNDAYAWFLYRQNDCIRNSKQQTAQTYLPHKELLGKHTDEQIELLKTEKRIDWYDFDDGKKYGRLIYKESKEVLIEKGPNKGEFCVRSFYEAHNATPFSEGDGEKLMKSLIPFYPTKLIEDLEIIERVEKEFSRKNVQNVQIETENGMMDISEAKSIIREKIQEFKNDSSFRPK